MIHGFIVDFYCDVAGLIVEADGGVHLGNPENDYARDAIFAELGLTVLHFTNEDILNETSRVLEDIRRAITD